MTKIIGGILLSPLVWFLFTVLFLSTEKTSVRKEKATGYMALALFAVLAMWGLYFLMK